MSPSLAHYCAKDDEIAVMIDSEPVIMVISSQDALVASTKLVARLRLSSTDKYDILCMKPRLTSHSYRSQDILVS